MAPPIFSKLFKKQRKHPIQRDVFGRSARRIAFDAFDRGMSPSQVSEEYGIKIETARRYYVDWKKLPPKFEMRYQALHEVLRKDPDAKQNFILMVSRSRDMEVAEVVQRLQKPYGLRHLLLDLWPNYVDEEKRRRDKARLDAALSLIEFIERCNMSPEELRGKIKALIDEAIQKNTAK